MKNKLRKLQSLSANDTTATATLNANFEQIEKEILNTLSRDGTQPNYMDADFDLNDHKIINIAEPVDDGDVVTKRYVDENIGNAYGYSLDAAQSANRAASSAQQAATSASSALANANYCHTVADDILNDENIQGLAADLASEDSVIKAVEAIQEDVTTVAGIASDVSTVANSAADISAVSDDLTNIDTVASNIADVSTVAGVASSVATVADNTTNINTVAGIDDNITIVVGIASDVTTVAGIASDISAVEDNATNINTVASNISDISDVASISEAVTAVNNNASNINTVAGNSSNINTVASNTSVISAVANNASNINAVNANKTNIDTVAGMGSDISSVLSIASDIEDVNDNATNINTVASNISSVNTVADDISNVSAVAADLANINAVAADLENIDNASTYADNAEIWAEGTDAEVAVLGGVHSAKGWADQSAQGQVQSNWTEADPTSKAYILNKPTIPTVNNATLTIQKNGTTVNTFTANASSNVTANITVPTNTNELTNGAGFITGINSSDVTAALGYTPANDSNVVKTSGNQTVGGAKTFTTKPVSQATTSNSANANQEMYLAKDTSLDRTVNPSYNKNYFFNMIDKNNGAIAYLNCGIYTNGSTFNRLYSRARTTDNSADDNCYIGVQSNRDGTSFTYAPTPATSDNSTKIATTAYVKAQGYALDSAVVKTSGNQNVGGVKTLTANPVISNNQPRITYKDTSMTRGTTPESGLNHTLATWQDTNGASMGYIQNMYGTDGYWGLNLQVTNGTKYPTLGIGIDSAGNVRTNAPTPATSDNSTKIATTAFVNNWVTANTSEVAVVVESEESGYHGWRIWSDGWVEQWGATTVTAANAWQDVTLDKPYASNVYQVVACTSGTTTSIGLCKVRDYSQNTTTKFGLCVNAANTVVRWYACGQGA